MTAEIPQYFANNLEPVHVTKQGLQHALDELRRAVRRAVGMLKANSAPPDPEDNHAFGPIYNGDLGIVVMALRLERQAKHLATDDFPADSLISEVRSLAVARVNHHILQKSRPRPGRLSPLGSASLGAALVRLLAGIYRLPSTREGEKHRIHRRDIATLREAVDAAVQQGDMSGGDEVLYGRAGLLFSVLNIQKVTPELVEESSRALLAPIFTEIPKLIDVILQAGMQAAQDYRMEYGENEALPLMWPWHGKYYVGAIHGTCGILAALLSCDPDSISSTYHPIIAETIGTLCRICIARNGHLPSSLPSRPSSRRSPLVQLCHGAPGLLILLSYAKNSPLVANKYWEPEWDEAIRLSSQRIWEEGLLYKGGGLCHGIAGNALPFLLLHDDMVYRVAGDGGDKAAGDVFLSRGLTFLLQARQTQPFNEHHVGTELHYRMPDTPYSLFEGLAGTVTAWAEACVVISARLRAMELEKSNSGAFKDDGEFRERISDELGYPGFSARGFL